MRVLPNKDLEWENEEYNKTAERILKLDDEQVASVFECIGIKFLDMSYKQIVEEIREDGNDVRDSLLGVFMTEAGSKEEIFACLTSIENRASTP